MTEKLPLKGLSILILRSNPVSPDPRVEKCAQTLANGGANVTVLAWNRTGKFPHFECKNGWRIQRIWSRLPYARGLSNFPAMLYWQCRLVLWLLKERKKYTVIHACDFDTILPALFLQKLDRKIIVYDIFDMYADTFGRIEGILRKSIRNWELKVIGKPNAVIIADESRKMQISGSKPKKLIVINNSPEEIIGDLQPKGRPALSQLHITYVGMLEYRRMFSELFEVFRAHPEWSLSLAGFGRDSEAIRKEIAAVSNICWYGVVPYHEALELDYAADVLIALFNPAVPNHRYSSPNKLFEAMLLGKPIIAAENTGMDQIIINSKCGIVIPYGDKSRLENAFLTLQNDPKLRQEMGENARKAYEEKYNWGIMAERLKSLYCELTGNEDKISGYQPPMKKH